MLKTTFEKFAILLMFLLSSCYTSYVTNNELNNLYKGMTKVEFREIVTAKPKIEFSVNIGDKEYEVVVTSLLIGLVKQYGGSTSTLNSIFVSVPERREYTASTIFLFSDKGLRYWGMRNEYSKSEDKEIANLAPELLNEYEKQFDQKILKKERRCRK